MIKVGREKLTYSIVAIKIIPKINLKNGENSVKQEAKYLRELSHPNIVKCLDFIEDDINFYLVMEDLEGGTLFDKIAQKFIYTDIQAKQLIKNILNAIQYLHMNGIVHGYIDPSLYDFNIFLLFQIFKT